MSLISIVGTVLLGASISIGCWYVLSTIVSKKTQTKKELTTEEELEKLRKLSEGLSPKELKQLRLIFMLSGFFIGLILFGNFIIGLILAISGYPMPILIDRRKRNLRLQKFNNQLVDGINIISNSLKAGFSIPQGLTMLVKELPAPIKEEFKIVLDELKLGISLEESLNNLSNRIKSDDLDLVVTATIIARETGGDLSEVYDRIASTIRQRITMQGRIRALTSQGKLQGIVVGLLPVAMLLLMSKIAPEIVQPLFTTFTGIVLLVVVFALELIGALLIKKIVTIDI